MKSIIRDIHGSPDVREEMDMKKICVVGASGKLGQYIRRSSVA